RRRHTRSTRDWSSDVCSSDLIGFALMVGVAIASYSLIDARAVHQVSPVGYLGAVMALEGLLLVGWIRGNPVRLRRALRPGIWVEIGRASWRERLGWLGVAGSV